MKSRWLLESFSLVLLAISASVSAQDRDDETQTSAAVFGGLGYSDNVGRTDVGEITTAYYEVGSLIDWSRQSVRADGFLTTDLSFREFEDDSFDSQLFGDLDAELNFFLLPDVLQWSFEDQFGQARRDDLLTAAPDNRQNINNFATGPTLSLPIGRKVLFDLSARKAWRNFEEAAQSDSTSLDVRADIGRAVAPNKRIGVYVIDRAIEFKDIAGSEISITSVVANYQAESARGSLALDVGVDRVDTGVLEDEGLRFAFVLRREFGAYSSFSISAGRRVSDSGGILGDSIASVIDRVDQIRAINDAFTRTNFSATFGVERSRTKLTASLAWIEDEFENLSENDSERYQVDLKASRTLAARTMLDVGFVFLRRDFNTPGDRDDEWRLSLGFTNTLSTRLQLRFGYDLRKRSATNARDFEENSYAIRVSYWLTK